MFINAIKDGHSEIKSQGFFASTPRRNARSLGCVPRKSMTLSLVKRAISSRRTAIHARMSMHGAIDDDDDAADDDDDDDDDANDDDDAATARDEEARPNTQLVSSCRLANCNMRARFTPDTC